MTGKGWFHRCTRSAAKSVDGFPYGHAHGGGVRPPGTALEGQSPVDDDRDLRRELGNERQDRRRWTRGVLDELIGSRVGLMNVAATQEYEHGRTHSPEIVRPSTSSHRARACSGAMYAGVPMMFLRESP